MALRNRLSSSYCQSWCLTVLCRGSGEWCAINPFCNGQNYLKFWCITNIGSWCPSIGECSNGFAHWSNTIAKRCSIHFLAFAMFCSGSGECNLIWSLVVLCCTVSLSSCLTVAWVASDIRIIYKGCLCSKKEYLLLSRFSVSYHLVQVGCFHQSRHSPKGWLHWVSTMIISSSFLSFS